MKSLCNYTQDLQTAAFEKAGAFFAFSQKQMSEKAKPGIEYISVGAGLIAPKESAKQLLIELEQIQQTGMQQDIEENGRDGIIRRELFNHECFYTGDISDCVYALEDYGISVEEILKVYRHIRATEDVD